MILRAVSVLVLILVVTGCAPVTIPGGTARTEPVLLTEAVRVRDAAELPLHTWSAEKGQGEDGATEEGPSAVILALHGFNDYGRFFDAAATWLAARGVTSYAYDQRGFGGAPNRGIWAGTETMVRDLRDATAAVRSRHPGTPLLVLGESMGGAVALIAAATEPGLDADGLILSAPAVRGRATMNALERAGLWVSAHTLPGLTLTGRGLGIKASDNIEMLQALGRDPKVIKETRIDAVWGLINLMDAAQDAAPRLSTPTLILYGERDELVPPEPTRRFFARLPPPPEARWRLALYGGGYHMLLRDLDAERVWTDIATWIDDPAAPLPSGADRRAADPDACRAWNLCDKVRLPPAATLPPPARS